MMASAALLMEFARRPLKQARATRLFFWVGVCGSVTTVGWGFTTPQYARSHFHIDVPCNAAYEIPFTVVKLSTSICLGLVYLYSTAVLVDDHKFESVALYTQGKMNLIFDKYSTERVSTGDYWMLPMGKREAMRRGFRYSVILFLWFPALWMTIESLLLIGTLVSIIYVRERAASLFGPHYRDNAVGYGQILAASFCLQTIVESLVVLKSK